MCTIKGNGYTSVDFLPLLIRETTFVIFAFLYIKAYGIYRFFFQKSQMSPVSIKSE